MACDKDAVKTSPSKEKRKKMRKNYDPKLPLEHHMAPQTQLSKWRKNSEIKLFMHTNYSLHPCSTVLSYVVAGLFMVLNLIEKG